MVLGGGGGGAVIRFPWFSVCCAGGGGAVIKFPLLLCMCTLLVWFGGAVVVGSRFRLLWGVGGGGGGRSKELQKNKTKNKQKNPLHKSHDTPAYDGAPHTKFGYKRLSTNAQPTGNKYLSHALQPSPPKTPQ